MSHGAKFEHGLALMLEAMREEQGGAALPPLDETGMRRELDELAAMRGRPAFWPYLGSGLGRGARAMMADGRWMLDFSLGIGVHFFGHGNLDLIETAIRAAASDVTMQGNLLFNREYHHLMQTLLAHAPRGLDQCWLSLSGADANENGLKVMRQKRDGRPGVIAFRGCFHGRTSSMAEITDRPDFRIGQPHTFPVHYLPFYNREDPDSAAKTLHALREVIRADGDRIACFAVELVQGEAGFVTAPREFFVPLFEQCRDAGIIVWADEVQTFARVGELFATDLLGLAEFVDVITVGKILQGSALLHRRALAPDTGLLSGTFSGATVPMAVGRRIIEKLVTEGFLGAEGRVNQLQQLAREHLDRLAGKHPDAISHIDGIGAMLAFRIGNGSLEYTRAYIRRCFEAGLALYYGGHDPACVRLFLPAGCLSDAELAEAFEILDRCLD